MCNERERMKTYKSKILERKRKSRKIKSVSREDALQKTNDLKIALKLVQKKLMRRMHTALKMWISSWWRFRAGVQPLCL